jgi:hypothetical protein
VHLKRYLTFIGENNSEIVLEYYCFDWDDNLLSMPTKINMEHKVGDEWIFNPVSTEHFAEIRSDKENWRPAQGAFIEFSDDGPRGDSAFLEDMKSAIGGAKSPQDPQKKAPSWDKFIQCLENGSLFSIITARAHKPETLRKGVEWIIDNYLSYDQKRTMYNNCLSFYYIFGGPGKFQPTYEKHKSGGAESPEVGKEIALKEFIAKAASFANQIGVRFKAGMSDDDLKNVLHMTTVLSELKKMYPDAEFTMFDTSKGGYQKKDIVGYIEPSFDETEGQLSKKESTHTTQAPGMASSVMSFTSFNNMSSRLFPANTKDNDPVANTQRMATDYITKQSKEWTKGIPRRKKKKIKK